MFYTPIEPKERSGAAPRRTRPGPIGPIGPTQPPRSSFFRGFGDLGQNFDEMTYQEIVDYQIATYGSPSAYASYIANRVLKNQPGPAANSSEAWAENLFIEQYPNEWETALSMASPYTPVPIKPPRPTIDMPVQDRVDGWITYYGSPYAFAIEMVNRIPYGGFKDAEAQNLFIEEYPDEWNAAYQTTQPIFSLPQPIEPPLSSREPVTPIGPVDPAVQLRVDLNIAMYHGAYGYASRIATLTNAGWMSEDPLADSLFMEEYPDTYLAAMDYVLTMPTALQPVLEPEPFIPIKSSVLPFESPVLLIEEPTRLIYEEPVIQQPVLEHSTLWEQIPLPTIQPVTVTTALPVGEVTSLQAGFDFGGSWPILAIIGIGLLVAGRKGGKKVNK